MKKTPNTTTMISLYVYLAIYVLFLLGLSIWVARRQSSEDFLISGRNRGLLQILSSKFAQTIGAGFFLTYTGFAYQYGFGVFAILFGFAAGFLLFGFWAAPRIHRGSAKRRLYTMGDYVYSKVRSVFARSLTNVVSSVILFAWLLVGVIGGGKIISDFGLMSYSLAVVLTAAIILAYILVAGHKAVIITDVVQAVIILLMLFVVTIGVTRTDLSLSMGGSVDLASVVGFFLYGLLAIFSFSHMYQLCYAAKDEQKLSRGIGLSIIPVLVVSTMLLVIGVYMQGQASGLDAALVFTEALKNFLPAALLPVGMVLFFAGIMSSADTNIYAIASHYALNKKVAKDAVKTIRGATITLVVFTTVIALIFRDIVDVSIIAGGISMTLSVPMIYLLVGGKKRNKFFGSLYGGVLGFFIGIAVFGIRPGAAIPLLIMSTLGLLIPQKET